MSSVTNGTNTVSEQEYYEYDSVGNITGIYKIEENEKVYYNRYYYDEANQIVREDNRLGEFTSTYTYDVGGNIVSRIRYPYTEEEITGLTATETHTYSYDNPTWGDVLTSYNGQPVTYDAMGNITSLSGDTYTWTAGRQLSRITKADNSYIDYFYDDNGQLSMYKMYNADNTLEGGSEYFWEGTKLIAVRLIEDENETDGMTAFMRIIYDSDGEPLGFLLNDSMPFLYTKNILGDITGVVYYENADYLFRYAYDAYGNYELIPPDDSVAAEIMAIIFHSLNPLTYRSYIFTPTIGISHYLGSRFYVPQLCRFMNADVYYDTATGANGTNKFAYCGNNPISFCDATGEAFLGSASKTTSKVAGVLIPLMTVAILAACVVVLVPIFSGGTITVSLNEAISKTKMYLDVLPVVTAATIATSIVTWYHESELQDIAGKYGMNKCVDATKAMVEYLIKKGLNGSIVHLFSIIPNQFIYCNSKNLTIAENGNHYGVLFMDNVYCNIHPQGLPFDLWVADFDARDEKKAAIYPLNWKFS